MIQRLKVTWLIAILMTFSGSPLWAGEIYSFLLPQCQLATGLVVGMEEGKITLLTLKGREAVIKSEDIQSVYVFSYLTNPISQIEMGPQLWETLKHVTIGEQTSFYGWPVRFVESLVMFYDILGRQHVHELDSITSLRPAAKGSATAKDRVRSTPISLSYQGVSTTCPDLPHGTTESARPNRVLADQIKIRQFLDDLQIGYRNLADYQERTYLYARPFLFEKDTRFSLVFNERKVERQLVFPFAIQWSSGRPYHFQSFTQFGGIRSDYSTHTGFFGGVKSEIKAHAFHIYFEGDMRGLSAGAPIYSTFGITDDSMFGSFADYGGEAESQSASNYMLMMGGDYGSLSLSAGYYFPVTMMRVNRVFREVLPTQKSYAVRVMWTRRAWRWRLTASPSISFAENNPTDKDIVVDEAESGKRLPASYTFKGSFVRTGVDLDWSKDFTTSVDFLMVHGQYQDYMPGGFAFATDSMTFDRTAVIATLRKDFGDYVGIRILGTWNQFKRVYNMGGTAGTQNISPYFLGGSLEFVF